MVVAIVTDSTSDLSPELSEPHHIHVVPTLVVIEGKAYQDGEGLSREEFYRRLPQMKEPPTTAAPSAGTFQLLYRRLLERGITQILSIHAASTLSGIYNAACLAAQPFGERVRVWDSGQLSMGLGFQVLEAARAALEGCSLETILEAVKEVRRRIRLIAMVDTLEYLRRSGRVSFLRASLGAMLRMRLFIELREGKVLRLEQRRTRSKGIARLHELLHNLGPLQYLAVLHADAEEDARQFLHDCPSTLASLPLLVNVTSVIGSHVGPGALGFAAVLHS